jgi:hypothetical protein
LFGRLNNDINVEKHERRRIVPHYSEGKGMSKSMKLNIYYLLFFDGPVAQFKFYKNKNRIRIFIIPINKGKQIAYIDYCHWRQLYIYIKKYIYKYNVSCWVQNLKKK